jgi:hypothetical protein
LGSNQGPERVRQSCAPCERVTGGSRVKNQVRIERRAAGCPHAEQECGSSSREAGNASKLPKNGVARETREQLVCELIHIREREHPLTGGAGPAAEG